MNIVSLTSYKEGRQQEEKRIIRHWKRTRIRYLGGKVYTALTRQHHCDRCIFPIDYLEQYLLDRYVRDRYDKDGNRLKPRFWYERSHWPTCYGPSEEDERRIREEMERAREAEERESSRKVA